VPVPENCLQYNTSLLDIVIKLTTPINTIITSNNSSNTNYGGGGGGGGHDRLWRSIPFINGVNI